MRVKTIKPYAQRHIIYSAVEFAAVMNREKSGRHFLHKRVVVMSKISSSPYVQWYRGAFGDDVKKIMQTSKIQCSWAMQSNAIAFEMQVVSRW